MRGPSTCSADAAHDKHPLKLKHKFQNNLYLSVKHNYYGDDFRRIYAHTARAKQAGISIVATNDVHYHVPDLHQLLPWNWKAAQGQALAA